MADGKAGIAVDALGAASARTAVHEREMRTRIDVKRTCVMLGHHRRQSASRQALCVLFAQALTQRVGAPVCADDPAWRFSNDLNCSDFVEKPGLGV